MDTDRNGVVDKAIGVVDAVVGMGPMGLDGCGAGGW